MDKNVRNRYTVGVLVSNEPGVLSRVSGLFSRRGFNIESLAVGPTQDQTISRITIVVLGNDSSIEQLLIDLYRNAFAMSRVFSIGDRQINLIFILKRI